VVREGYKYVTKRYNKKLWKNMFYWVLLILIIFLGAVPRFWRISEVFEIIDLHSSYGAYIIKTGIIKYIFEFPILYHHAGPFSDLLTIPFLLFFGQTIFALKFPFAISGVLAVFFLYLFVKEFYSEKEALLSSFILAIFPPHIFLSTISLPYVFTSFFVTLILYIFYKYSRTRRDKYLYLGSAISGLGVMVRLSLLFFLVPFVILVVVFKGRSFIKKSFKKLIIAFLFFIFAGGYPLILLNLDQNIKAVTTLHFTEDLRDVVGNLERGFIHRLPMFFNFFPGGSDEIFNFLSIFLFALISMLIIRLWTIHRFFKVSLSSGNDRSRSCSHLLLHTFKKDIFILILLFGTLILTSTVAITYFHVEEYVIASPLIAIIIGKGIYEILKISRFHMILFFIISVFCLVVFFSTYTFFTAFSTRSPSSCVRYIPELVKVINEINHSEVVGDDVVLQDALGWYGLPAEPGHFLFSRESPTIFSIFKEILDDKKVLYVFQPPECAVATNLRERFQEEASRYNRSVIKERDVVFENMTYTLYRVV
jgi:hypothetical protein